MGIKDFDKFSQQVHASESELIVVRRRFAAQYFLFSLILKEENGVLFVDGWRHSMGHSRPWCTRVSHSSDLEKQKHLTIEFVRRAANNK